MNEPFAMQPADAPIALGYSTQRPRRRWGGIIAVAIVVAVGLAAHLTRSQWWPPVQGAWEWHAACEKARKDVLAFRESLDPQDDTTRADCDHVLGTLAMLDPLRPTVEIGHAASTDARRLPLSEVARARRAKAIQDLRTLSRKFTDRGRYEDALRVVNVILVVDPRDDYATGVHQILFDTWGPPPYRSRGKYRHQRIPLFDEE